MASISNVKLSIDKGGDTRGSSKRRVRVSYTVNFSAIERDAGSVFRESVRLRGDDPVFDDDLTTISSGHVKATSSSVTRNISVEVSRSRLDEDGDTVILGWVLDAARDEIYARVDLTPFVPSATSGTSNVVTGQFGAGGND